MSTRSVQLLSGLFVLALAFGCKPKPGGKCLPNASPVCFSKTEALTCQGGTYKSLSCRGANGCTTSATQLDCDNTLAQLNDGCATEGDVSCQVDKKAALQCKSGKFEVAATCKGTNGCASEDNLISCDDHVADLDDPCHQNGNYACTSDKKGLLQCVDNKFATLDACKGTQGCRIFELPEEKKTNFSCDDTFADENDACDTEGRLACSTDKKALLSCKSKKFTVHKKCGTCNFDDKSDRFSCDGAAAANIARAALSSSNAATAKTGSTGAAKPASATTTAKPAASAAAAPAAGGAAGVKPAASGITAPVASAVASAVAAKPGASAAPAANAAKPGATPAAAAAKPGAAPAAAKPAAPAAPKKP